MKTYYEVLDLHDKYGKPHLRLGQFFVVYFIKKSWPELFYMDDHDKERELITQWLIDNQYTNSLPPFVKEIK